jgi:hypothetical protein
VCAIVGITIRIQFDIQILTPHHCWSGQQISITQDLGCTIQKMICLNIATQGLIDRRCTGRRHSISFDYFSRSFSISHFSAQEKQNRSWKFWILRIYSVFKIQFNHFAAVSQYLFYLSLILQYFSIYRTLPLHFIL